MVFTQQASRDIYAPQDKGLETFVKTDFLRRPNDTGGIIYEEDPVVHRQPREQISPAFSDRSISSMEPVMHRHTYFFIKKMRMKGHDAQSINLMDWTNWGAMDIAADMGYCQEMREMEEEKNAAYLQLLFDFRKMLPALWVFKRFPLVSFLRNLFLPWSKLHTVAGSKRQSESQLADRIRRRGATDHMDYFEMFLPSGGDDLVTNPRQMADLGVVARQIVFAQYQPVSDWFYSVLLYLACDNNCYSTLVAEIRGRFDRYEDITSEALTSLPYLNACLEEPLRLFPGNNTGMARISPGAVVDGTFVLAGVYVQTSFLARGRSSRHYHDARNFRPQRFLPRQHKLFEECYSNDDSKNLHAFSLGTRGCIGQGVAWIEGRLFLGKLLWSLNMVKLPGQQVDLDNMKNHGLWLKSDFCVTFNEVERE